ncbi:MAG: hypothetical protein PSV40_10295 [Polaromonas sp.]|uniref:hypothetical protein n=1 Tax=Polaromonas sp. TaxID=1869339 RepID=UPI0024871822|nr:hypothetical protein [Polaromonas sp.]MDI1269472.1 hypothetical protein [Polaromonas sp.]
MPMLPSGRQVAIQINIRDELLNDADSPLKVQKVLAIRAQADIYPYTDVLWLVPKAPVGPEQKDSDFLEKSLPRPPGLEAVSSGYRLSQHEKFSADWSDEDKKVFWEFIHVRAAHLFEEALSLTTAAQELLRTRSDGTTKLMVAWWDAGVHPAQEGAPVEVGELPVWDTYDMLAAMGQILNQLKRTQLTDRLLDNRMRLTALWSIYEVDVPQLKNWPDPADASRLVAQQARDGQWLEAMPPSVRSTLHRQCVHECVTLWDHLGEQLDQDFPEPAKIINLVVVSPEANASFNR